jgi:hypothetical protein
VIGGATQPGLGVAVQAVVVGVVLVAAGAIDIATVVRV